MKSAVILMTAVGLGSTLAFSGARFWEQKDYHQWSKQECETLLTDSPWAKTYGFYRIQLRSALPVRQAVVRQMQIEQQYEDLPAEKRRDLEKTADDFLSRQLFTENVVVRVTGAGFVSRLLAHPPEEFRRTVSLIGSNNKKIPPLQYLKVQEDGYDFVFPRQLGGRPLIDPRSKYLWFEFPYRGTNISAPEFNRKTNLWDSDTVVIEFKVSRMLVSGRLAY